MNLSLRTLGPGIVALTVGAGVVDPAQAQTPLYRSDAFTVTPTEVRQGRWTATALSRDSIVSTYPRAGREMHFRFSINGQDNEFHSGTEHTLYIRPADGRIESPLYVFGQEQPPFVPTPEAYPTSEEGAAQVTIRLDLRHVLRELEQTGSYRPPLGEPIRRADFRAVYAIGDVEPLSWDASRLRPGSPAQLTDPDGDGVYTLTLPIEAQYTRPLLSEGRAIWARQADLSAFPRLRSPEPLLDALYRMSLEELTQLVREDGALSAGAKWPGVWTRDVAYASVLALAIVAPDAVRRSLMAKVDSAGRIIQDTGTGGSWPISTDRMTWTLAAWELYAVTGDADWLRTAYGIISRSARADLHAVIDPATGLVKGETSFMDWREQSYPRWMDPRDIGKLAGAEHQRGARGHLPHPGRHGAALGEHSGDWTQVAEGIEAAIQRHLTMLYHRPPRRLPLRSRGAVAGAPLGRAGGGAAHHLRPAPGGTSGRGRRVAAGGGVRRADVLAVHPADPRLSQRRPVAVRERVLDVGLGGRGEHGGGGARAGLHLPPRRALPDQQGEHGREHRPLRRHGAQQRPAAVERGGEPGHALPRALRHALPAGPAGAARRWCRPRTPASGRSAACATAAPPDDHRARPRRRGRVRAAGRPAGRARGDPGDAHGRAHHRDPDERPLDARDHQPGQESLVRGDARLRGSRATAGLGSRAGRGALPDLQGRRHAAGHRRDAVRDPRGGRDGGVPGGRGGFQRPAVVPERAGARGAARHRARRAPRGRAAGA